MAFYLLISGLILGSLSIVLFGCWAYAVIRKNDQLTAYADELHRRLDKQRKCVSMLETELAKREKFFPVSAEIVLDADRWRALLNSGRLRQLGRAGFGTDKLYSTDMYRHFGMEFWTLYNPRRLTDERREILTSNNIAARKTLTDYADAMRKIQGTDGIESNCETISDVHSNAQ